MTEFPENSGITHVFYHGSCFDGFTAAWIAKNAGILEDNIYPVFHGNVFPELPEKEPVQLLIADFSGDREVLENLKKKLEKSRGNLIILDHHKTAKEVLEDVDWAYFDMDESGASLVWKFFHPDEQPPKLVRYIKEHDLWRFELPNSAQVRAYLRSFPMTYENWDELNTTLEMDFEVVQREGSAIQRSHEAAVTEMCKNALIMNVGGYEVPVTNATIYFSEVATRLLKMHPTAEFACYYMDRADGIRQWGMRSRSDFDVSVIAKRLGGGGHPQAAGFSTEVPNFSDKIKG